MTADYFIGCVVCGRYEVATNWPEAPRCCGWPMYGEEIPNRPDNRIHADAAYLRARVWARTARAAPREDAPAPPSRHEEPR